MTPEVSGESDRCTFGLFFPRSPEPDVEQHWWIAPMNAAMIRERCGEDGARTVRHLGEVTRLLAHLDIDWHPGQNSIWSSVPHLGFVVGMGNRTPGQAGQIRPYER